LDESAIIANEQRGGFERNKRIVGLTPARHVPARRSDHEREIERAGLAGRRPA
jgi:hypothetical protein